MLLRLTQEGKPYLFETSNTKHITTSGKNNEISTLWLREVENDTFNSFTVDQYIDDILLQQWAIQTGCVTTFKDLINKQITLKIKE